VLHLHLKNEKRPVGRCRFNKWRWGELNPRPRMVVYTTLQCVVHFSVLAKYVENEQNHSFASSRKNRWVLWERPRTSVPDGYITTTSVSDIRTCDARSASEYLRSSECEPERVCIRAWYAILCTYEMDGFLRSSIRLRHCTYRRGKPSMPVIPLLFSKIFLKTKGGV